jgi:signal peptidase II
MHAMRRTYFLAALLIVVLDRVSKWVVERSIALHDNLVVIPGFFHITHVQNRGAAFGLFDDSPTEWKIATLILFSVVAMVIVTVLLWRNSHVMSVTGMGLAIVLGGAVGNLWDRLVAGHVTDFLDFNVGTYHWPAFNVADSAIVIGAVLLMADIIFAKHPHENETKKSVVVE